MSSTLTRFFTPSRLKLLAAVIVAQLIYYGVFTRPFPLARHYLTVPPVDYAKLTGHSPSGAAVFIVAVLALFGLYWYALRMLSGQGTDHDRRKTRLAWVGIFGTALVSVVILTPAYPTAAIDVLIYAVRTLGWAMYGLNPLATAPQAVPAGTLAGLAAEWSGAPSPYGSIWEGTSLLLFRLAGGDFLPHLLYLKAMLGLVHILCALVVALILLRIKPKWALVGAAAFAWNPVALLETAGNGHNDILMVLFLLLAIYFCTSRRLSWLAFPSLALAMSTKIVPVIGLPFFLLFAARQHTSWVRRISATAGGLALTLGITAVLMIPVWPGWESWAVRDLGQGAGRSPFALLVLILRSWMPTTMAFDVSQLVLGGAFALLYAYLAWKAFRQPIDISNTLLVPLFLVFYWYLVLPNQQFHAWYLLWPFSVGVLLLPSRWFTRVVLFQLTAWLAIPIYETFRVWWWNTLTPLVVHLIAVPFVFGVPLLVDDLFDLSDTASDQIARPDTQAG